MKKKILVIEDEQMLAKIIGMKLEEEGFEVSHAYDGEQAYQILTQPDLPDMVLLDVLLPKMSGFEVLERLKAEGRPTTKVIVFSNFAQKADVEKARDLGAIDYIVKAAFSPAEIISKIKAIFAEDPSDTSSGHTAASINQVNPYQNFASMEDVMPMADVLHPNESKNNL